jgi:hypothetical protein
MIQGSITFEGFAAEINDGTVTILDKDGKDTDQKKPIKCLTIRDTKSPLQVNLVFDPDQFSAFVDQMSKASNKIVTVPGGKLREFFTRNGGIRR